MLRYVRGVMVVVFMFMLAGCASTTGEKLDVQNTAFKAKLASGQLLVIVERTFTGTGETFKRLCTSQVIRAQDCQRWQKVAKEFQSKYDAAGRLWLLASNVEDERSAANAILELSGMIAEFALIAANASAGGR